jgi:hypothetical protein
MNKYEFYQAFRRASQININRVWAKDYLPGALNSMAKQAARARHELETRLEHFKPSETIKTHIGILTTHITCITQAERDTLIKWLSDPQCTFLSTSGDDNYISITVYRVSSVEEMAAHDAKIKQGIVDELAEAIKQEQRYSADFEYLTEVYASKDSSPVSERDVEIVTILSTLIKKGNQ